MKTQDQTLHQSFNSVKLSNIIKQANNMVNSVLYSSYFNQFISIILK